MSWKVTFRKCGAGIMKQTVISAIFVSKFDGVEQEWAERKYSSRLSKAFPT
jgi:hypothetical protein